MVFWPDFLILCSPSPETCLGESQSLMPFFFVQLALCTLALFLPDSSILASPGCFQNVNLTT